jgi:hypothetical protein
MKNSTKKDNLSVKSGEQVIQEKINAANEFLRKADLSIIYESMKSK